MKISCGEDFKIFGSEDTGEMKKLQIAIITSNKTFGWNEIRLMKCCGMKRLGGLFK